MRKQDFLSGFYSAWATAWGPMGAVAGPDGLRRVILPNYQVDELFQLLAWDHPKCIRDDKPFERLTELSRDYFNGKPVDFGAIPCDLPDEGSFSGKVLRACRAIPYGRKMTYSSLAGQIGCPESARAVGTALGKNPIPLVVPCHRVVNASGGMSGFSAPGGINLKRRMLELERKASGTGGAQG
ncbi:MAG: methylated-DNA--[protein]-cysteine S-methyltransferase [Phycisphaerae bacterium]